MNTFVFTVTGSVAVNATAEQVRTKLNDAVKGINENYPGEKKLLGLSVTEIDQPAAKPQFADVSVADLLEAALEKINDPDSYVDDDN